MKERNHFDSKDIVLLIVVLVIIYLLFSWFGNDGQTFQEMTQDINVESTKTPQEP